MFIELNLFWLLVVNTIAWFFFHMSISLLLMRIPDEWFVGREGLFKTQKWEKDGKIWDNLFHIREWKKRLPDGSRIIKNAYNKTNLHGTELESLCKFIIETKRAELTHWLLMLPAPLFFMWNPPWAGLLMVLYAIIVNVPFILSQRFNRPRLERLYELQFKREMKSTQSKRGFSL